MIVDKDPTSDEMQFLEIDSNVTGTCIVSSQNYKAEQPNWDSKLVTSWNNTKSICSSLTPKIMLDSILHISNT